MNRESDGNQILAEIVSSTEDYLVWHCDSSVPIRCHVQGRCAGRSFSLQPGFPLGWIPYRLYSALKVADHADATFKVREFGENWQDFLDSIWPGEQLPLHEKISRSETAVTGVRCSSDHGLEQLQQAWQSMLFQKLQEESRLQGEEFNRITRLARYGVIAAAMSHDIRNYMTTVSGYSELAADLGKEKYFTKLDGALDRLEKFLGQIVVSTRRLQTESEAIPVQADLQNVVAFWQRVTGDALQLQTDTEAQLSGNRMEFHLAVLEILQNAHEHRRQGDDLTVTADMDSQGDLVIRIVHEGTEADPEKINDYSRVFQSSSRNRMGLGLPLTKQVTKNLGGRFTVEATRDRVDVGMVFASDVVQVSDHR